jgi:hypothetical protein
VSTIGKRVPPQWTEGVDYVLSAQNDFAVGDFVVIPEGDHAIFGRVVEKRAVCMHVCVYVCMYMCIYGERLCCHLLIPEGDHAIFGRVVEKRAVCMHVYVYVYMVRDSLCAE